MCPRFLVVGADSSIGSALCQFLQHNAVPYVATSRRPEPANAGHCYLHLGENTAAWHPPVHNGVAIICVGISSLQLCEVEPEYTYSINVYETMQLIKCLVAAGNRIVFLSTSQVFDGAHPLPSPQNTTKPQTEYGLQKSIVEKALLHLQPDALVLRLSKVITRQEQRFSQWRNAWQKGVCVDVFADMWLAPIFLEQAVRTLYTLITHNCSGIWHISPATELSYAELAIKLAKLLGHDASLMEKTPVPSHIPSIFCPRHVALDSSATWQECGMCPPLSEDALQEYVTANGLV